MTFLPGHQDERDLTRLRADREEDRDDEAALVRAEEREKPRERAAVGDGAHCCECSDAVSILRVDATQPHCERARWRGRAAPRFGRVVEPAARAGRVRERDDRRRRPARSARRRSGVSDVEPEQTPQREPADRDDQLRPQQLELPVAPERAELLLARRRRAVAAAGRRRGPGSSASPTRSRRSRRTRPRRARASGAASGRRAAPRQPLLSLDDARRLAEEIRALPASPRRAHGQRLERIAGLDAGAAAGEVALERGERAVRGLARRSSAWSVGSVPMLPLEAVPNFSEGRDRATIDAIGEALAAHARVLDVHSDPDHNRSVYTLVGGEDELVEALLAGIACCARADRPARSRGRSPADRRRGRRPARPDPGDRRRACASRRRSSSPGGSVRSSSCRSSSTPTSHPAAGPPSSGAEGRPSCSGASTPASSLRTSARRGSTSGRAACSSEPARR